MEQLVLFRLVMPSWSCMLGGNLGTGFSELMDLCLKHLDLLVLLAYTMPMD